MKFKKLTIRNLRSYKDQEIEFPEGSLLLSGDIGAGKTSILLAIEYALFGLQPGQKGASLLRNNEDSGEVILELEASGKTVMIERKLKRTLKGVSNEYAGITIDGIKQESSLTEIKLKVVNLLGYPLEFVKKNNILYRYTVYTQQEQMKQIILEDAETRLNILRHVFGIDKYKQIKENLLVLTTNLKSKSKILQGEILTLEEDKKNLELRKEQLKIIEERISLKTFELNEKVKLRKDVELILGSLKEKLEEKFSIEKEIERTKVLILTKKETLSLIIKEIQDLKKTIEEAGEPFDERIYFSTLNELKLKKGSLENWNSERIEIMGQINSLHQDESDTLAKKERIFRIDICPTCLQDVSENHKHNITNETESKLIKIKKALNELESQQKIIFSDIEKNRKDIITLEETNVRLEILKSKVGQIEKSRIKLQSLEKQKEEMQNDEIIFFKHVDSLKEKLLRFTVFENQFKKKEEELRLAVQEEKTVEISLAESRKELELSHREITLSQDRVNRKEASKKKLYDLIELIDWLSKQFLSLIELTERNVLLKLRNEFSALFRKWFLMLVPEDQLDSQIDENFTPIIMQGDVEMDYSFLSGGERTAVALAYRLALNQTINSLMSKIKTRGIIMLDEPTDGFSEAQIDKMRDIFEELNAEQLIIVSHEHKIEGFVDNVFKVVKEGDLSFIEPQTTA